MALIRCPSCEGLRTISVRWMSGAGFLCKECSRAIKTGGEIVHRKDFCAFWSERFTTEEIQMMAEAIWT